MRFRFPFRGDNRRPDGFWDAPDATDENVKGSSVDPYDPVWPRWTKTPALDAEGEFVSSQPFFDIDEITQAAKFYPPGAPLVDKNVDGNPASRQRVRDNPAGNHWRRRLLLGPDDKANGWPQSRTLARSERPLVLAEMIPRNPDGTWPAPQATEENIKGSSVDPVNPVWPRWEKTPPLGESGDFISDEYFYDIDETTGVVTPYPPRTPLPDTNLDGNPGSRLRGNNTLHGNPWRRRLQVWRGS